jgi:hypothetical protein
MDRRDHEGQRGELARRPSHERPHRPANIADLGDNVARPFLEFFTADNRKTRAAYSQAVGQFPLLVRSRRCPRRRQADPRTFLCRVAPAPPGRSFHQSASATANLADPALLRSDSGPFREQRPHSCPLVLPRPARSAGSLNGTGLRPKSTDRLVDQRYCLTTSVYITDVFVNNDPTNG